MRNWQSILRVGLPLVVSAIILSGCTVSADPGDVDVGVGLYPYDYGCCYGGFYHGYYGHGWDHGGYGGGFHGGGGGRR